MLSMAAVFAAFALVVWLAYGDSGPRVTTGEPPLIRASTTPFKVPPDDPGGRQVEDLGAVGNLLGEQPPAPGPERLLPPPEEPLRPALAAAAPEAIGTGAAAPAPTPAGQPVAAAAAAVPEAPAAPELAARSAGGIGTVPIAATADGGLPAKPAPAEQQLAKLTPPAAAAKPAASAAGAGRYRVQLAAVREQADAERAWSSFQRDFAGVLGSFTPFYERADTDNGVFFRVQVGPFADSAKADQICAELKQRNASCFVISR